MNNRLLIYILLVISLLSAGCNKKKMEELKTQRGIQSQIIAYKIALKLDPDDFASYTQLANLLYQQGQREEALNNLNKSLSIEPNNIETLSTLAYIKQSEGEYAKAEETYQQILSLDPNDEYTAFVYGNMGVIAYHQKKYDQALSFYDKAIGTAPNGYVLYNKGISLYQMGRSEEALTMYDLAIEMGYSSVDVYTNRGIIFANANEHQRAITAYAAGAKYDDESFYLNLNWAISLYHLSEYRQALEKIEKAIAQNSNDANTQNTYGMILERLDRYDEAQEAYQKATELSLVKDSI